MFTIVKCRFFVESKKLGRARVFCLFGFGFFLNGLSFECGVENHEDSCTEKKAADDIGKPVDTGEKSTNDRDYHEQGEHKIDDVGVFKFEIFFSK